MKKCIAMTVTALCLLLAIVSLAAGCGGSKPATKPSSSGSSAAPSNIGVPVYPGTTPEEAFGVTKMVTTDSYDQVVAFYKKALPGATFSEITIPSGKGASLLVDTKEFHGNVSIEENLPSSGKVTISVSKIS